jgi:prevent-host-death family protein
MFPDSLSGERESGERTGALSPPAGSTSSVASPFRLPSEAALSSTLHVVLIWTIRWSILQGRYQLVQNGCAMRISVTEAKSQLTDLVRRAEAGDEIILTRHGQAAVRLVPVTKARLDAKARKELLEAVRASGAAKASSGPGAGKSQDFLYDENGLPR